MTEARFTAEQTADFLQQSRNGVSNKVLYGKYESGVSMFRRWQEQYAEGIRRELKQLESTGAIAFLFFFISATLLAIMFSESLPVCVVLSFLVYCVGHIRQFRKISAKHIQEENIFLARSGHGMKNVFYHFGWTYIALFVFAVEYITVRVAWKTVGLTKHSLWAR